MDDRLKDYPGPGVKLVQVQIPKTSEMLTSGHILYTHMRNPLVHARETLDVRTRGPVAHVVLDFEDKRLVCREDDQPAAD